MATGDIFPSPLQVLNAIKVNFAGFEIYQHIWYSLYRVLVGFIISFIAGTSLAFLAGTLPRGGIISLLLDFFRPIPPIAWTPIAILLFGIGDKPAIFIVFTGGIFPIFSSTLQGVLAFPTVYQNTAATYEIRGFRFFRKLLLPFSLPYMFTGIKTGIGMCWMCLIAAEMIGAQSGLGYFIQVNRLLIRTDYIVMGMLIIAVIGLALLKLADAIQKFITPWNNNAENS